ncbi:hypothetical protein JHK86_027593 [Glycine max]|nr:hypothetical protein JHK86_027593 [Glycine max]
MTDYFFPSPLNMDYTPPIVQPDDFLSNVFGTDCGTSTSACEYMHSLQNEVGKFTPPSFNLMFSQDVEENNPLLHDISDQRPHRNPGRNGRRPPYPYRISRPFVAQLCMPIITACDRIVNNCTQPTKRLKIEYLDLYLIHWPINVKPGDWETPYTKDLISAFNLTGVWKQMEECKKLGLAKSIGVSNFTCKKLKDLLSFATIPPSVNQKKLKEFCDEKGIIITAFSPLGAKGASWGSNVVMDSEILKEIAKAHGRTIAQVCQWWVGRYDGPEGFTTLVMRLQTMGFR